MGLPLQACDEKTVHREETHWLSGKEKVLGAVVSKGHADGLLEDGRTYYWFSQNRYN